MIGMDSEKYTNPTKICPKCGKKMIMALEALERTSAPPCKYWDWWCGCGYKEKFVGLLTYDVPSDNYWYGEWLAANKHAEVV
jgi:ribosomal protein S27AE